MVADRDVRKGVRGPCRNVTIANNRTIGGICSGELQQKQCDSREPQSGRHRALIRNSVADATVDTNQGYEVVTEP